MKTKIGDECSKCVPKHRIVPGESVGETVRRLTGSLSEAKAKVICKLRWQYVGVEGKPRGQQSTWIVTSKSAIGPNNTEIGTDVFLSNLSSLALDAETATAMRERGLAKLSCGNTQRQYAARMRTLTKVMPNTFPRFPHYISNPSDFQNNIYPLLKEGELTLTIDATTGDPQTPPQIYCIL